MHCLLLLAAFAELFFDITVNKSIALCGSSEKAAAVSAPLFLRLCSVSQFRQVQDGKFDCIVRFANGDRVERSSTVQLRSNLSAGGLQRALKDDREPEQVLMLECFDSEVIGGKNVQ